MPVAMLPAFIPSPGDNGVHFGPLFVHGYGLMYAIGVVVAVRLTSWLCEARGGRRDVARAAAVGLACGDLVDHALGGDQADPGRSPPPKLLHGSDGLALFGEPAHVRRHLEGG